MKSSPAAATLGALSCTILGWPALGTSQPATPHRLNGPQSISAGGGCKSFHSDDTNGVGPDLYAKAVTRVSLAKAVSEVDTGASATNTFPPADVHTSPQKKSAREGECGRRMAAEGMDGVAHVRGHGVFTCTVTRVTGSKLHLCYPPWLILASSCCRTCCSKGRTLSRNFVYHTARGTSSTRGGGCIGRLRNGAGCT